jgi:hypothetical protein
MTEREAFEAYFEAKFGKKPLTWAEAEGAPYNVPDEMQSHYYVRSTQWAWEAWQASRQQALGEAERVCGNQIPLGCSTSMVDVSRSQGVRACIDSIRSLSHPTGGK